MMDPNAPLSRPLTPQPGAAPTRSTTPSVQTAPPPLTDGSVRASTPGENTFGSLRTDAQGRALAADPNDPVLNQQPVPAANTAPPPKQAAPQRAPNPGPVAGSQLGSGGAEGTAKLPDGTPKAQYDFAFDFLKRQDYPNAETTFREFLKKYPKDPLAGNAQYWLGETHYVRGDYQKAAVEFMNGYQNYPKSNKAPDNLLKLGMALANIGQTQGACTALGRLNKEYPDAGDQIRRSVQQERTKLKCPS
ncbi:MAG: tol-pal system protein YbgF [Rhodospirillaceae bacterium]|nr:tol-pal system protein YbgF [Rhodospirillaceae bacterium]